MAKRMDPQCKDALCELRSAFKAWRDRAFVDHEWVRNPTSGHCQHAVGHLDCLWSRQSPDPLRLNQLILTTGRAKELIENGLMWQSPVVGGRNSESDGFRGLQWRLIMVWGGVDLLFQELTNGKIGKPLLEKVCGQLDLPEFQSVPAPKRSSNLRYWLEDQQIFDEDPINNLMKLSSTGVKTVFRSWLIDGHSVDRWEDAILLATGLRHASVHGAMSATKVRQWRLIDAFDRLAVDLGWLAAGLIRFMAHG